MVSILKNQILKHLSKFTKNLSADKINLSTLKGEGELSDLDLDEIVLTDLLELPSWLRLTSAFCNKVSFRIQWAKLKSIPIRLSLDEVTIEVETCEELRSTSVPQDLSSYPGTGKYSFINKVIDGMTVTVNTVQIKFKSPAFTASVEISRIIVESKSRDWKKCELSQTRIKDTIRGQILLFKELEWQNVRIEARSTRDRNLTPLRLLTNKARCRITIKKRTSDCFILGSRLAIILEDLLWVLTDFQLKAALHFLDSLAGLIQKATESTRKKKAARKLEALPEYQAQQVQAARAKNQNCPAVEIFSRYDVVETSYHFLAQKIDLHFCEDPGAGRSCHPELKNGGALQVSLKSFQLDYYPYHLAIGDRINWATYREASSPHTEWLKQAQAMFTSTLLDVVDNHRSQHAPLSRNPRPGNDAGRREDDISNASPQQEKRPDFSGEWLREYILRQMNKLMTSCLILRILDFNLYQVTTSSVKKHVPKDFISGDKERYYLPENESVVHAEFTYYYFPGDDPFPLPPPKFYVLINPVQIHFDVISLLWLNAFALNLHQSLMQTAASQDPANAGLMYFDVKIEAIMPRIIFESTVDHPGQKDRPKSLHIQVPRAYITNVRSVDRSSRADLEKCVDSLQMGSLFFNGDFPSLPSDFPLVTQKFIDHVTGSDNVRAVPQRFTAADVPDLKSKLSREMLWIEAKDVWCIHLEPIWGDFYGTRAIGKERPVPFLDAFPLTLWVYMKMPKFGDSVEPNDNTADIHALAHVSTLVSLQLNHYQYLFLLRLSEDAQELATYLAIDSNRIVKKSSGGSLVVGAVISQVEITLVMPSQSPGKESSGGDVESVFPDSSSLQDDVTAAGNWQSSNSVMNPCHTSRKINNSGSELSMDIQRDNTSDIVPPAASNNTFKTANGNAKLLKMANVQSQSTETPLAFGMKIAQGFKNVFTSLDISTKNILDDTSDNVSIQSDASSDSENFVVVFDYDGANAQKAADPMASMFRINPNEGDAQPPNHVEVATEVIEEENTLTSPSERDSFASYCKRRDLVSMSTFKLGKVELLQQSKGLNSAIKVQVSNIGTEECSSIPWDEFQTKFSSRCRDWMEIPLDAGVHPKIKLRLDRSLKPNCGAVLNSTLVERSAVLKWFDNTVDVRLQAINLGLNASTLTGLTDLIEDEVLPSPLPATIYMEDIKLHITEDRPPCHITSPGPVPIDLVITRLIVNRTASGVIEIVPPKTQGLDKSNNSDLETTDRLIQENEELRRRLAAFERLSEDNYRGKRCQEENEILRSRLTKAHNEIATLSEAKRELSEKIRTLEEIHQFERNAKR